MDNEILNLDYLNSVCSRKEEKIYFEGLYYEVMYMYHMRILHSAELS